MKQIVLIMLLLPVALFAQDKIVITDSFETSKYQWSEEYEGDKIATISDGYYNIENKSQEHFIAITDFPFEGDHNFKVSTKVLIPKFGKKNEFGIVFDYDDDKNFSALILSDMKFRVCNFIGGIEYSVVKKGGIILKAEKGKLVSIEFKKVGKKITFLVDNMEIGTISRKTSSNSSTIGFYIGSDTKLMVDEIEIEQVSYNR